MFFKILCFCFFKSPNGLKRADTSPFFKPKSSSSTSSSSSSPASLFFMSEALYRRLGYTQLKNKRTRGVVVFLKHFWVSSHIHSPINNKIFSFSKWNVEKHYIKTIMICFLLQKLSVNLHTEKLNNSKEFY